LAVPICKDNASALRNSLIGFKGGRNSKEKKNNTKPNKRNFARPESGLISFFQKLDILN
jgi:hypothetical protein